MKKTVALTAAGSLVALGGAAFAGGGHLLEQIVDLGDWVVDAHDIGIVIGPSIDFTADFLVTEWHFDVDYVNQFDDSSWASDLEFKVTNAEGDWVVGQQAFDGGDPFGPEDEIWDFDGADSQPTGPYSHDSVHAGGAAGGWNVMLAESWDGGVEYNNMTLTLHGIPAPGALALLGVAGLVGGRRRRK